MSLDFCSSQNRWDQIISNLPKNLDLDRSAKDLGAFVRSRKVKCAKDLFHMICAYSFCHLSFREAAAWSTLSNIANISDVGFIKRLKKSLPWLEAILYACLQNKQQNSDLSFPLENLKLIDATYINSIGSRSSQWRIHTSYNPHTYSFDFFQITNSQGAENVERFPLKEGDLVIADRGYAKIKQICFLLSQKAHYIIRTGYQTCSFRHQDGTKFNLFEKLRQVTEGKAVSTEVYIGNRETKTSDLLASRLIIARKQPEAIERAKKRSRRKANRQCYKVSSCNLEAAEYFMILTSLPESLFDTEKILRLYRIRWQIEIAFKKIKSLMHIDHLKVKDPLLIQVCLCVRLIIALLIDKVLPQIYKDLPFHDYTNRVACLWRMSSLLIRYFYVSIIGTAFQDYWLQNILCIKRNLYDPPRKRYLKTLENILSL
jgi:hypothetical protein